jgi:eukaryotic-like serine/threonine-protein kinase
MQLLCPACHAPLPAAPAGQAALACPGCALEVDLSRLGTLAGKPRFLPERDRTGTTVGGYAVEGWLGSGGMGHVHRAGRDTPAGRQVVALKLLAVGLAGDAELRARFLREVQVLQRLAHPAIVRVLDSGEADGVPWFAMNLVAGPSLRARLVQGPLAAGEARVVFARVLSALEHAHAQGVIHRDLKPGNVLLGSEGAVLADFGIARPGEAMAAPMTRLTESAAILGTLPYMSPEQRSGAAIDGRSDLFSVGVMLYEAVTGSLPQGAFPPPSRARPGLPARLDRVVMRLLQPRPDDRPATAAEAARALDAALAPSRRRALGLAASAAGAVALAVAGIAGWSRLDRPVAVKTLATATPASAGPRATDEASTGAPGRSPGPAAPASTQAATQSSSLPPAARPELPVPLDRKALLMEQKRPLRGNPKKASKEAGTFDRKGAFRPPPAPGKKPGPLPKNADPADAQKR